MKKKAYLCRPIIIGESSQETSDLRVNSSFHWPGGAVSESQEDGQRDTTAHKKQRLNN